MLQNIVCLEDHGKKDKMLQLTPLIRPDVIHRQKAKQIRNTQPQMKNLAGKFLTPNSPRNCKLTYSFFEHGTSYVPVEI